MEIQFQKSVYPCLKTVCRQMQNQELTQEIRLPDGMPDIGNTLAGWGQVIIRGKDWRTGSAGVNGGVMVWVLYQPEDGSGVQKLETWIPFQENWDFSDTQHDGSLLVNPVLRNVDVRNLSARKMMVRTSLGMMGQAVVPQEIMGYLPQELPEDVQVLEKAYPMVLPMEAGEKAFSLEETITLPANVSPVEEILRYSLVPEIAELKVVSDKLVLRGIANLTALYLGKDGQLHSWEFALPFSQYAQLDREYEPSAQGNVTCLVTALELEIGEENSLKVKAGITCQYTVEDGVIMEFTEDAYSPMRSVVLEKTQVIIPAVLEKTQKTLTAEQRLPSDIVRPVDVVFYPEQPTLRRQGDNVETELTGGFQLLGYDNGGQLQAMSSRWQEPWSIVADRNTGMELSLQALGKPTAAQSASDMMLSSPLQLNATAISQAEHQMITGIEVGEPMEADPMRPSLVLRRAGEKSLWELAKENGSTVQAIQSANHLQDEPDEEKMLIIPVL